MHGKFQSGVRGMCARRELKRLREAKREADRLLEERRRLRAAIVLQVNACKYF